jgi:hypothetical protein
MSVSLNRLSTTIVAAAVIAAAFGFGSALGAPPPRGMSAQEYKALVIRSQALNDLYGEPGGHEPVQGEGQGRPHSR